MKKNETPKNNFNQEAENKLYNESYKTLMKENEDKNEWKDSPFYHVSTTPGPPGRHLTIIIFDKVAAM